MTIKPDPQTPPELIQRFHRWTAKHLDRLEWAYHYSSFAAGIALTTAFAFAWIARFVTPTVEVPITNIEATYKAVEIGQIPKARLTSEPPQGTKPVIRDMPALDASGRPETHEVLRTVRGNGRAYHSGEEIREVVIPRLGEPPYREYRRLAPKGFRYNLDGRTVLPERPQFKPPQPRKLRENPLSAKSRSQEVHTEALFYDPNVVFDHTGVFERLQKIEFRSAIDPEAWAIYGAILGTIVGVAVFFLRDCARKMQDSSTDT